MNLLWTRHLFWPIIRPALSQARTRSSLSDVATRADKTQGSEQKLLHRISDDPKLVTKEELASGRKIKKLSGETPPGRTVNDLPMELAQQLILDHLSSKNVIKIGRRKITKHVAGEIQARWNTAEVVKLHADHRNAKSNMRDLAYEVELQSGGIVIWMSGAKLLVYVDKEHNKVRAAHLAKLAANDRQAILRRNIEARRKELQMKQKPQAD